MFHKLGYLMLREYGHLIMINGERRLVIPRRDPINAITMGALARDAGLTPQEFRELRLAKRPIRWRFEGSNPSIEKAPGQPLAAEKLLCT